MKTLNRLRRIASWSESLLAAHWLYCLYYRVQNGGSVFVTFNIHDRTQPSGSVTWESANIIINPRYNPRTMKHDLAIIKFGKPLSDALATGAIPVCLPSTKPDATATSYVSGWGTTYYGNDYTLDRRQWQIHPWRLMVGLCCLAHLSRRLRPSQLST